MSTHFSCPVPKRQCVQHRRARTLVFAVCSLSRQSSLTKLRFLHLHLSLNRGGCWGTTDDFTTSFLHFSLLFTALWDLVNSRPIHPLMLSSHLFSVCLLLFFTVPCKMVLARPDEQETFPYHFSLHLFTMVGRSSCGLNTSWLSQVPLLSLE